MAQSAIAVADHELAAAAVPVTAAGTRDDLLKLFGSVPDGRSGQGRDHPVGAVLALAAAAVVAGMKGYTAIAGWVKDVPPAVLADLYMRAGASPARPPSKASPCTGCATLFTKRTNRRSEPGPGRGSRQLCATWLSAPCACMAAPISPKPPDGPAGPWTGHSPSSASLHDLETAVLMPLRAESWPLATAGPPR
jgi:DDE family transposase